MIGTSTQRWPDGRGSPNSAADLALDTDRSRLGRTSVQSPPPAGKRRRPHRRPDLGERRQRRISNAAPSRVKGRIVNVGRLGGFKGEFDFDLHAMKRIRLHRRHLPHALGGRSARNQPAHARRPVGRGRKRRRLRPADRPHVPARGGRSRARAHEGQRSTSARSCWSADGALPKATRPLDHPGLAAPAVVARQHARPGRSDAGCEPPAGHGHRATGRGPPSTPRTSRATGPLVSGDGRRQRMGRQGAASRL